MKIFVAVVLAVAFVGISCNAYYMETPCASRGGMCFLDSDCAADNKNVKGLCPEQQSQGVECCQGLPISENICQNRGGQCSLYDGCEIRDLVANDCQQGEVCCLLIS